MQTDGTAPRTQHGSDFPPTIEALVERLAMLGIDVEPDRCDPAALRMTAWDLTTLAALLEGEPDADR